MKKLIHSGIVVAPALLYFWQLTCSTLNADGIRTDCIRTSALDFPGPWHLTPPRNGAECSLCQRGSTLHREFRIPHRPHLKSSRFTCEKMCQRFDVLETGSWVSVFCWVDFETPLETFQAEGIF